MSEKFPIGSKVRVTRRDLRRFNQEGEVKWKSPGGPILVRFPDRKTQFYDAQQLALVEDEGKDTDTVTENLDNKGMVMNLDVVLAQYKKLYDAGIVNITLRPRSWDIGKGRYYGIEVNEGLRDVNLYNPKQVDEYITKHTTPIEITVVRHLDSVLGGLYHCRLPDGSNLRAPDASSIWSKREIYTNVGSGGIYTAPDGKRYRFTVQQTRTVFDENGAFTLD